MASIVWKTVKKIHCDCVGQEAELLEERIYLDDPFPDVGQPFQVRARKCSLGMDCNLAAHACRWSYINPNYDPFEEA
jgi:hypothetical protein